MAVNLELGVDLGSFNQGINQAKAQISTFNATLKFAEASFKATGDAESAMITKTTALTGKLKVQRQMVQQYAKALQDMKKNNVDETSAAFQKMQKNLILAQASMNDTQAALNGLNSSQQEATQSADKLSQSVQGIGKRISLDQVINGVNRITDGLETAARKAVEYGRTLWNEILDTASKADDVATKALMYDMTPERYQAVQKLANTWAETSVESIVRARQRIQSRMGDMTDLLMGIGVDPYKNKKRILGTDQYVGEYRDWEEVFWDIGDALLSMDDSYRRASVAEDIFGRKWEELKPMFEMGRDAYEKAIDDQIVASDDAIKKLSTMNDTVNGLKSDFESLETEVLAGMAPALTAGANAIDKVLGKIMEYLETPEGQDMLSKLSESVSGLFDDLTNINPEDVVSNFVTVFDNLTNGLTFIKDHWGEVKTGIIGLGAAFGGLKIAGGVLEFVRLISGLRGLGGGAAGAVTDTVAKVASGFGGKFVMNGIESTLGTKIGSVIASSLTSTPMTVMIAAASIGALAHAIYTVINTKDPMKTFLTENGVTEAQAEAFIEASNKSYNPFDTKQNARNTRLLKDLLSDGKLNESEPVEIPTTPKVVEDAASSIEKQIGAVTVPVNLRVSMGGSAFAGGGGGGGLSDYYRDTLFGSFRPGFANGLPYVPNEGLYLLHRGERVTPAREVSNRSFNSNLYVESMIMNNGTDANGLASAMAAAQRRTMSGYGS